MPAERGKKERDCDREKLYGLIVMLFLYKGVKKKRKEGIAKRRKEKKRKEKKRKEKKRKEKRSEKGKEKKETGRNEKNRNEKSKKKEIWLFDIGRKTFDSLAFSPLYILFMLSVCLPV